MLSDLLVASSVLLVVPVVVSHVRFSASLPVTGITSRLDLKQVLNALELLAVLQEWVQEQVRNHLGKHPIVPTPI